jgi:hypothetical protein
LIKIRLATPEKPEPLPAVDALHEMRTHRNAADILFSRRSERLRSLRILADRKRRGDPAIRDLADEPTWPTRRSYVTRE